MGNYTTKEVLTAMEQHTLWLKARIEGGIFDNCGYSRGVFNGIDFSNLSEFIDVREKLRHFDFSRAIFSNCCFIGVDLHETIFENASIFNCNFGDANLIDAKFREAQIRKTSFHSSCLFGTDFRNATFSECDFSESRVSETTCWQNSDFNCMPESSKYPYIPYVCPSEGSFIAWKKCRFRPEHWERDRKTAFDDGCRCIVKLMIPEHAQRSSGTGRKCRASEAVVLQIQSLSGEILEDDHVIYDGEVTSIFDLDFLYRVGKTVRPRHGFMNYRWQECAPGIHFFLTREEAVNYDY